jgi:hypothetical protein
MADLDRMNFMLAYKRVRDELVEQPKSSRAFVEHTFERELAETDLEGWLSGLKEDVTKGHYAPQPVGLSGAPKGGDLVRPAARMALADRVVYTAAVGSCVKHIVRATRWSRLKVDFATVFHKTRPHQRKWLLHPFEGWQAWADHSVHLASLARTQYVVTADIAGFFENVSLKRLRHELLRVGAPEPIVDLLTTCLHKWALVEDRGLPQGVLASDVLAKLYLESFDKRLKDEGHTHVRYADDIRVFCRSRKEARGVLVLVTEMLRERGLTVQTAKTKIRTADDEIRREFAGAIPAIRELHRDFVDEALLAGLLSGGDESIPVSVIDDLIDIDPQRMDRKVIRRAWREFVLGVDHPNPSLFRYVLRRFAAFGDDTAVDYCAPRLRSRPEAIPEILRYFQDLDDPALEVPVAKALASPDLHAYPYSRYLLLDWLLRNRPELRVAALRAVRDQAFGGEHPQYVRAVARAVLGKLGASSDLDRLAALLPETSDQFERAQLLCTLTRLEKGRRNALAGRLKSEGPWGRRAWVYVRAAE